MLELQCPKCKNSLKIDEAFAGSVCRCSHCGTLMTIPALPSTQSSTEDAPPPNRHDDPLSPSSKPTPSKNYKLKPQTTRLRSTLKFITLLLLILLAVAIAVYLAIYLNQNPTPLPINSPGLK